MQRMVALGLVVVFWVGLGCTSSSTSKKTDFDLPVRSKSDVTKPAITQKPSPPESMSLINHAPVVPATTVVAHDTTPIAPAGPLVPDAPFLPPPPVIDPIIDGVLEDDYHHEHEKLEQVLFNDDFNAPFSVGNTTEKWTYGSIPPFVGNDGIETVANGVLTVRSKGLNGMTNEPAFTLTVPQETMPTDTSGTLDHVKWLVYPNHQNPDNTIPGHKAVNGKKLVCETWLRGQTFGTAGHPFGADAETNDMRLASFTFNSIDIETFMVFNFFITNAKIYATYERLPLGRGAPLGNYAAFMYAVPVMDREPSNFHHLEISYDRQKGVVRWLIDHEQVFKVTAIGKRLESNEFLTLNHGGDEPERPLKLNQLSCGMGHFTLLDAFLPTKQALVKLSTTMNLYFSPLTDALFTDADFTDPTSLAGSRLFGQGVQTEVKKFQVKYVSYK